MPINGAYRKVFRGTPVIGAVPERSPDGVFVTQPRQEAAPAAGACLLRGGQLDDGDHLGAAGVALRGVARLEHLRRGVSLAGPAVDGDRRAAAVAVDLAA